MVLQRNADVKLWGWADERQEITINASWLEDQVTTTSNDAGEWMVTVPTNDSRNPQTVRISGKRSEIILENILFGEVWLCSGQSNMERDFISQNGEPVFHALQTITHATNSNLRLFTIERAHSKTPLDSLSNVRPWEAANPDNVAEFSAIAYFFGSQLQTVLDVPVGLIHSAWGGSEIQAWIGEEALLEYEAFDLEKIEIERQWSARKVPTALFNGMINPITKYAIKGVLWYQGESNRHEPELYQKLLPAMVANWRQHWDIGDFPFYYAQVAPYDYEKPDAYDNPDNTAFLREAQLLALDAIDNAEMTVTLDLGQEDNIHPPRKREVGDRLLYQALHNTYDYKAIDDNGPAYKSLSIASDSAIVTFEHAERGLYSPQGLSDFEIAGEDRVFYPATATIIHRKPEVLVKSDKVPNPVAVRYGWSNWVDGSLFDTNLLPASSFRTDRWDDARRAKEEK